MPRATLRGGKNGRSEDEIKIQVAVESNERQSEVVREVARLEAEPCGPRNWVSPWRRRKRFWRASSKVMTEQQASEFVARQQCCADCGKPPAHKGRHEIVVRTPFGKLNLKSPGFYHCGCQGTGRTSFSPCLSCCRSAPVRGMIQFVGHFPGEGRKSTATTKTSTRGRPRRARLR